MTDAASPLDRVRDLLIYAPVGLAVTVTEELPRLVDKGRQRVAGQLTLAHLMGELAVAEGQRQLGRLMKRAAAQLQGVAAPPGATPASPVGAVGSGPEANWRVDASAALRTPTEVAPTAVFSPSPARSTDGVGAPSLAIPGYDLLSASQVVQRLAGLSAEELEEVRLHEAAHRGRKTILNRVSQLQSGRAD